MKIEDSALFADLWYMTPGIRIVPCAFFLVLAFFIRIVNQLVQNRYYYQYLSCLCWVYRVGELGSLNWLLFPLIHSHIIYIQNNPTILRTSYKASKRADKIRMLFTQSGKGKYDLSGNFIVLKKKSKSEKGVILLKYGEVFEGMVLLSEIDSIFKDYHVVLEMSWEGVCDPTYLLFLNPQHKVFIEATSEKDFNFLNRINSNLIPVRIASNDWMNAEKIPSVENEVRDYDVVMVANWGIYKNHRKLFLALENLTIKTRLKVALIGFPWANRTKDNILDEFNRAVRKNKSLIELIIHENIPHNEVLRILSHAKMIVLLSYKEGCNKGITEAFVCNTPAIVYDRMIGGALEKINEKTGVVSSFEELPRSIDRMLKEYATFEPRKYYLENSGSLKSTSKLNNIIKLHSNEKWVTDIDPKINEPGLGYLIPGQREKYIKDYAYIESTFPENIS